MKIRGIRVGWVGALLVAVVLLVLVVASFVTQPSPIVSAGKGKGLGKDQLISGQAFAREFGVRKGDAFPFLLEVLYDPIQVAGIDRASLDRSVDVKPFEIRGYQETDYAVNDRTRVYRREYTLQLIEGKVDQAYQLPTIVVRYQLPHATGYAEKAIVPNPISTVSRLPADVTDMELRPISDKIDDPSRDRLIGVLWAAGGLVALGAIVHLTWRVIPEWRVQSQQRRRINGGDVIVQAYRSLDAQLAMQADAKSVLHQIDHVLRLTLAQKEKMNWLEEPNLDRIPAEIRLTVMELFSKCQQSYGINGIGPTDLRPAAEHLDAILEFYFGAGEVEAWRH